MKNTCNTDSRLKELTSNLQACRLSDSRQNTHSMNNQYSHYRRPICIHSLTAWSLRYSTGFTLREGRKDSFCSTCNLTYKDYTQTDLHCTRTSEHPVTMNYFRGHDTIVGRDSSRYSDSLRAGRPGDQIPVGARYSYIGARYSYTSTPHLGLRSLFQGELYLLLIRLLLQKGQIHGK